MRFSVLMPSFLLLTLSFQALSAGTSSFRNFLPLSSSIQSPSQYYQVNKTRLSGGFTTGDATTRISAGDVSFSANTSGQNFFANLAAPIGGNALVLAGDLKSSSSDSSSALVITPKAALNLGGSFALGAEAIVTKVENKTGDVSVSSDFSTMGLGFSFHNESSEFSLGYQTQYDSNGIYKPASLALHARLKLSRGTALGAFYNTKLLSIKDSSVNNSRQYGAILEARLGSQFTSESTLAMTSGINGVEDLDDKSMQFIALYEFTKSFELGGCVNWLSINSENFDQTYLNYSLITAIDL